MRWSDEDEEEDGVVWWWRGVTDGWGEGGNLMRVREEATATDMEIEEKKRE